MGDSGIGAYKAAQLGVTIVRPDDAGPDLMTDLQAIVPDVAEVDVAGEGGNQHMSKEASMSLFVLGLTATFIGSALLVRLLAHFARLGMRAYVSMRAKRVVRPRLASKAAAAAHAMHKRGRGRKDDESMPCFAEDSESGTLQAVSDSTMEDGGGHGGRGVRPGGGRGRGRGRGGGDDGGGDDGSDGSDSGQRRRAGFGIVAARRKWGAKWKPVANVDGDEEEADVSDDDRAAEGLGGGVDGSEDEEEAAEEGSETRRSVHGPPDLGARRREERADFGGREAHKDDAVSDAGSEATGVSRVIVTLKRRKPEQGQQAIEVGGVSEMDVLSETAEVHGEGLHGDSAETDSRQIGAAAAINTAAEPASLNVILRILPFAEENRARRAGAVDATLRVRVPTSLLSSQSPHAARVDVEQLRRVLCAEAIKAATDRAQEIEVQDRGAGVHDGNSGDGGGGVAAAAAAAGEDGEDGRGEHSVERAALLEAAEILEASLMESSQGGDGSRNLPFTFTDADGDLLPLQAAISLVELVQAACIEVHLERRRPPPPPPPAEKSQLVELYENMNLNDMFVNGKIRKPQPEETRHDFDSALPPLPPPSYKSKPRKSKHARSQADAALELLMPKNLRQTVAARSFDFDDRSCIAASTPARVNRTSGSYLDGGSDEESASVAPSLLSVPSITSSQANRLGVRTDGRNGGGGACCAATANDGESSTHSMTPKNGRRRAGGGADDEVDDDDDETQRDQGRRQPRISGRSIDDASSLISVGRSYASTNLTVNPLKPPERRPVGFSLD